MTICGHPVWSLRQVPVRHNRGGKSTENKVRFAPPTMCRLTVEYMDEILAQYKPRITPATLIPPIIDGTNIFLSTTGRLFRPTIILSKKIVITISIPALNNPNIVFLITIPLKEEYSLLPLIKSKNLYIILFMMNIYFKNIFLNFQYNSLFIPSSLIPFS